MIEKEKLQDICKELRGLESELQREDYKDMEQLRKVCTEVEQKLQDCRPTMMFYGIYNTGKSTLLNALFGEELAGVSDKPETSKIARYEFRGNIIYDTPGLNAPKEHEKVTMEHYKVCDIILFVLDTNGGFEDKTVYDRIKDIITESKKPFMVVLNDKAGLGLDSEKIQHVRQKIQENISRIIPNNNIIINVVSVNAKSALKAKLENKNKLLESSNITELERKILELFAEKGIVSVLNTCCVTLSNLINDCKGALKQSDSSLQSMQNMIDSLERQHDDARIRCKGIIENTMYPLDTELINPILLGQQELAEQCYNHKIQKVQERLESEFSEILQDSKRIMGKFMTDIAHISGISMSLDRVDIEDSQVMDMILAQLKTAGAEQIAQMAKPAIELGLQGIKQLFPELMKGIGPVTIGKMAGRAIPIIGTLIQAVIGFLEILNAEKAHEKRVEKERANAMEARQRATQIREQAVSKLFDITEHILKDSFEKALQSMQQSMETAQNKNAQQEQLRGKLENMRQYVNDIQVKLTLQTPNQA
ncbi:MAG: 50S ribosome-binding GTPase [Helicobacter sp.]|nr:50S ribosome-binding GTPase [Helicobacter sp.]